MALKHVPHVQPRNDSLAGPEGRRGDQVCGFLSLLTLYHVCYLCSYPCTGHVLPCHRIEQAWLSAMLHLPDAFQQSQASCLVPQKACRRLHSV